MQFLSGSDCIHAKCRHEDIEVADIMTPLPSLPTLRLEAVVKARVGDILETFRASRQSHLVVTDCLDGQRSTVRGLISRMELERRLGISSSHASAAQAEREASMLSRVTAA